MTAETFPKPSITIKIGEEAREITMFFGRLHELAEVVQVFERLPEVDFHAPTREAVMDICLAPRDERGVRIKGETATGLLYQLTVEDAYAVLDFAKEHLADFFLARLEKQLRSLQANGDRLTGVGRSLNGLAGSASSAS